MFFPNFIFFNFLIFIGIINVNSLYVKFKFNLKFKCGDELANGRLMVNYRKAMYSGYTNVLDVVVINGIFKKDVVVPFPRSSKYSFDVLFRTNCYIFNKNKEVWN
uniref:Uncharacterized protein n=1 Tax=Meloidogyne enterolobii TaxID=390850 RepID=A0A6V7WT02_MELEN|nr:unnamed protein product [Meloidogyne enterolobii]